MIFERRDFDFSPEIRMDEDATRITGYAAVFNRLSSDLGGFVERIAPGAFKRVLGRGDDVLALFNHDMDNLLATRSSGTLRLSEDDTGLRYEFDLDQSDPDHQRIISKVKRGDLKGSSFGFRIQEDDWGTTEQDYPLRTIKHIASLRDVGPVSMPAYPDTASIAPLALRSLSDLTGHSVEDLVAAESLRDFLLEQADETRTRHINVSVKPTDAEEMIRTIDEKLKQMHAQETEDAASGETLADSPVERTRILPPRVSREWWADYQKG